MVQSTPIVSSDGASGTVVGTIDSGGGVCSYVDIIKETNETNSTSGERPSGSGDTKIGRKAGMAESKRWGYGDASALFASASSAAAGGSTFDASALRRELVQRDTVIAELAGGAAQQAQEAEQEIMALRQALESAETAVTILQEARFGNDDNNNNYDRGQMMAVSIDGAAAAATEAAAERRAAAVVAERVAERTSSLEEALEQNQLAAAVAEVDALNPQIAARLATPLTRWKKFDTQRQELMQNALRSLVANDVRAPSKDLFEIVSKSLPS